jgi:hypothetical protein
VDSELGADTETESGRARVGWWQTGRGRLQAIAIVTGTILVVILAILVVRGPSTDAPAAPPPRSTSSTTLSPEAEVEQAYRAFWDMSARLSASPDPGDPEIARRSTGQLRDNVEETLRNRRDRGEAVRVGAATELTVLSTVIHDDTATMKGCFVDQASVVTASTGDVIQPTVTVTRLETATAVRQGGVWKLSRIENNPKDRWQGVSTCAK